MTLTLASIRTTTTTTTSMPLLGTTVCMALQKDPGRRMGVQALVNSVASVVSEGGSEDVRRMVQVLGL